MPFTESPSPPTARTAAAQYSSPIRGRSSGPLLGLLVLALPALIGQACQRQADLVDEPDATVIPNKTPEYDGSLPMLDAGFGSDAFLPCDERPVGLCKGSNDFVCGFNEWARKIAQDCQKQTSCKTNGWLTVKLGDDGCVQDIGMDRPNPEMVACLLDALSSEHCPCKASQVTYYFGEGNSGACPDGGPKG